MNTRIDKLLAKFTARLYMEGGNNADKITEDYKSELLKAILASKPEKYTPAEMLADIDASADYRDGYNRALEQWEEAIEELFEGGGL